LIHQARRLSRRPPLPSAFRDSISNVIQQFVHNSVQRGMFRWCNAQQPDVIVHERELHSCNPPLAPVTGMHVRRAVVVGEKVDGCASGFGHVGMGRLSCRTAGMCKKELAVYMLSYNLIRLLMAEAAVQAGALPRQLSFKHTVQVWISRSQRQFLSDAAEDIVALFGLISQIRVGNRPGRVEPWAVKQRPISYN
jgi:hypothetical protein